MPLSVGTAVHAATHVGGLCRCVRSARGDFARGQRVVETPSTNMCVSGSSGYAVGLGAGHARARIAEVIECDRPIALVGEGHECCRSIDDFGAPGFPRRRPPGPEPRCSGLRHCDRRPSDDRACPDKNCASDRCGCCRLDSSLDFAEPSSRCHVRTAPRRHAAFRACGLAVRPAVSCRGSERRR